MRDKHQQKLTALSTLRTSNANVLISDQITACARTVVMDKLTARRVLREAGWSDARIQRYEAAYNHA